MDLSYGWQGRMRQMNQILKSYSEFAFGNWIQLCHIIYIRVLLVNTTDTFSFSAWKAGFIILLCLTHFSPSRIRSPPTSNLERLVASFVFSKWPNLFDRTSRTSSGSVIVTLGYGPNHVNESLPAFSCPGIRTVEECKWLTHGTF